MGYSSDHRQQGDLQYPRTPEKQSNEFSKQLTDLTKATMMNQLIQLMHWNEGSTKKNLYV